MKLDHYTNSRLFGGRPAPLYQKAKPEMQFMNCSCISHKVISHLLELLPIMCERTQLMFLAKLVHEVKDNVPPQTAFDNEKNMK